MASRHTETSVSAEVTAKAAATIRLRIPNVFMGSERFSGQFGSVSDPAGSEQGVTTPSPFHPPILLRDGPRTSQNLEADAQNLDG